MGDWLVLICDPSHIHIRGVYHSSLEEIRNPLRIKSYKEASIGEIDSGVLQLMGPIPRPGDRGGADPAPQQSNNTLTDFT